MNTTSLGVVAIWTCSSVIALNLVIPAATLVLKVAAARISSAEPGRAGSCLSLPTRACWPQGPFDRAGRGDSWRGGSAFEYAHTPLQRRPGPGIE